MCPELPSLANGTIMYSNMQGNNNTEAWYICNTGYTLSGNKTRVCMNENTWSGMAPTCTGIQKSYWE